MTLSLVARMVSKARHVLPKHKRFQRMMFFLLYIQHNYTYLVRTQLQAFYFLSKNYNDSLIPMKKHSFCTIYLKRRCKMHSGHFTEQHQVLKKTHILRKWQLCTYEK